MAASFIGLFALAGLAALVFLAVLGLITLLTNPKTRDVAKVLLGGLAAMILLVVLVGGLFLAMNANPRVVAQHEMARREVATARLKELGERMHAENARIAEVAEAEIHGEGPSVMDADEPEPANDSADEMPSSAANSDVELPPDPRDRKSTDDATEADAAEPVEAVEEVTTAEPEPVVEETAEPDEGEEAAPEEEIAEESEVGELSVAPLPDANRPAWVDREPYKEGSVYYWPVAADPHSDEDQAEFEALPEALQGAVADYVNEKLRLGSLAARQVHLDPTYLRSELVGEDIWIEPRTSPLGEFYRVHALVKFDREANTVIREAWEHEKRVGRLWSAGGFLGMALLFLSLVYCYLKIDQVTKGSRRALLRFAAILVILGLMLVAAGVASVGIA